jgi:hypothetical protein
MRRRSSTALGGIVVEAGVDVGGIETDGSGGDSGRTLGDTGTS